MMWATFPDVECAFENSLPASSEGRVTGLIEEAEKILLALCPGVTVRITSGSLDRDLVKIVIVRAVLRVLRNPEGFVSETDGDYTYRRNSSGADGAIGFTRADLGLLGFAGRNGQLRTFGIRPSSFWQTPA